MVINEIKFDPEKDQEAVSQTGFVDLYKAYETHTIPSVIDDVDVAYNEIEDPSSIIGKPGDIFEATRMMSYINEAGKSNSSANNGESSVA